MIAAPFRFKGHNSLRYVYSKGKAIRSPSLTVKFIANERRKHPRVSVVISKKVLKSAVGRNRVRRRIYEYIRLRLPDLVSVHDIVIICTSSELRTMPADELATQLNYVFDKTELFS